MGLFMAEEPGELSEVRHFSSSIAGAEYNVAVGLARLGHTPAYCTRLGMDPFGDKILAGLRSNGISESLVSRSETELTGFMMKSITEKGDPKIAYYRKGSAASKITPEDIDALDLAGCGWLHLTGIFPAISQSALAAVHRLKARAKELGMTVSFDPNLRPQLWESQARMAAALNDLAQGVDLLLPGISEGKILCGADTAPAIAAHYHALGVGKVVVKVGGDGAYFSEKDGESGISPGFPVRKIVDTVGAGDGFAAGVISALAEGLSLKKAAFRGNVIGAIQISNKSDNEGLPTKAQLESVIKEGSA